MNRLCALTRQHVSRLTRNRFNELCECTSYGRLGLLKRPHRCQQACHHLYVKQSHVYLYWRKLYSGEQTLKFRIMTNIHSSFIGERTLETPKTVSPTLKGLVTDW